MYVHEPKSHPPACDVLDAWLMLPDDLNSPATARGMLAENIKHLPTRVRDDLAVLVSELVTNAIRHGRPDVELHLIVTGDLVRVEVYDEGDAFSAVRAHSIPISQSSGRGLVIVDTLATRWGVDVATAAQAKNVWCELSVTDAS
jgi:anti-sigma regulatory factor (Ser/Thr protein kinase)